MRLSPNLPGIALVIYLSVLSAFATGRVPKEDRTRDPKIVGGTKIVPSTPVPWMVSLKDSTTFHLCGGTVIRENVVLTAAHCIAPRDEMEWFDRRFPFVAVGNHDSEEQYLSLDSMIQPKISVIHPNYSDATIQSDIALLFFDQNLTDLNGDTSVISLPQKDEQVDSGSRVSIYGWGLISEDDFFPSNQLQRADVVLYDRELCEASSNYGADSLSYGMICAGNIEQGGVDSCAGDSGGPLIYNGVSPESDPIQLGIVSWGDGCGKPGYPGVYTDTRAYLDWIEEQIAIVEAYKPLLTCFPNTLQGEIEQFEDIELTRSTPLQLRPSCVGQPSPSIQSNFNIRDECVLLRDPCVE